MHFPFFREINLGVPDTILEKLGEQSRGAPELLTVAKMFFNVGRQLVGEKKRKHLFFLCFPCCFDFLFSFSKTACQGFESFRPCHEKSHLCLPTKVTSFQLSVPCGTLSASTVREVPAGMSGILNFTLCEAQYFTAASPRLHLGETQTSPKVACCRCL